MATQQERVAQTNKLITNALVKVGRNKALKQITVSDLTRTSGISRGTFYLHYLDKDDLVNQLEDDFAQQFQDLLDAGIDGTMDYRQMAAGQPYPVIVAIVAFAARNKALLNFFFGPHGDPAFLGRITTKLQTAILGELKRIKGTATFRYNIPATYALSLVTNAIMSIVTTWLASQEQLSQAAVSSLIMQALYLSPYEILGIKIK